ncbi:hypothetical protein H6P81_009762 [Aristolochia fimbriata]|uniref:Uncharacterized protein n=1 Tax=Aristolochia fimbriata TaxID=158543 RepID=A0AAV7ELV0_ARIFI|nr:hypothetical protein H6P81_009762 [Aristolochia fimbriata]
MVVVVVIAGSDDPYLSALSLRLLRQNGFYSPSSVGLQLVGWANEVHGAFAGSDDPYLSALSLRLLRQNGFYSPSSVGLQLVGSVNEVHGAFAGVAACQRHCLGHLPPLVMLFLDSIHFLRKIRITVGKSGGWLLICLGKKDALESWTRRRFKGGGGEGDIGVETMNVGWLDFAHAGKSRKKKKQQRNQRKYLAGGEKGTNGLENGWL